MTKRTRARRATVLGARMLVANAVADLVNISRTGALIRLGFELRAGGEWPLVLELPSHGSMWLSGKVVRCRPEEPSPRRADRKTVQYLLGLTFVNPPHQAVTVLDEVCGMPTAVPALDRANARIQRRSRAPVVRLRGLCIAFTRRCPACLTSEVTKASPHRYSCDQCGHRFTGFRLGPLRLSV